jgi:hypothetical protein
MKRCFLFASASSKHWNTIKFIAACAIFMPASSLFCTQAWAQSGTEFVRNFPAKAQRGKMVVTAAPQIEMNGKPDQLSPGARIRSTDNTLVSPAFITGQAVIVNYTREPGGMVHEAWILTEAELKEKRPGLDTKNFSFSSEQQMHKPDDGNTPYKDLPKYGK